MITTIGTVYGLVDPETKMLRYIGITLRKPSVRYAQHLRRAQEKKTHRDCWIYGLSRRELDPEMVIFEQQSHDQESLNKAEMGWISYFRKMGFNLTNSTDGGEGNAGWKASAETKLKMSLASKGRAKSSEMRARLSASRKGKKLKPTGPPSKETKAKMSQNCRGRPVYCSATDTLFASLSAATRAFGLPKRAIEDMANGVRTNEFQFKWAQSPKSNLVP